MISLTRCASAGSGAASIVRVNAAVARVRDGSLDMVTSFLCSRKSGRIAVPVPSYPLRQFDGYPAKPPDRRMQQGVADCILGAMFARGFAMFPFIRLECGNVCFQLRVLVAQFGELLGIMAVDFRFDGIGA